MSSPSWLAFWSSVELNQDLLLMREFTDDQVFTYEILGEIPKQLQQYVNGLKKF